MAITVEQREGGRVAINLNGKVIGNARALASVKNPLVSLNHVVRLSELEEIAKELRKIADHS